MARPRRGVDGRLTLLALLIVLVPQVAIQFRIDLSTYLPPALKEDPARYLVGSMALLYAVSLALAVLEVIIPADRSRVRARWLAGLNVVLRLAQGVVGALIGIFGGVFVTTLAGLSSELRTASLWIATLLLVLIVALPFLNERLGRRTRPALAAPTPVVDDIHDIAVQEEAQQEETQQPEDVPPEAGVPPEGVQLDGAPVSSVPASADVDDAVAVVAVVAGDVAPQESTGDDASASGIETLPVPSIGRGRRAAIQVVLLGAFGLDLLLYSLVVPFLPGEAQRLGATPLTTGILFAMYAAGIVAATPLAAWLTDSIGPRPTLLWGLIALASSTLLFAYSPTLSLGLPGLFGARAAQGIASTLTWTAGFAVLAQLHTAEERSRIFARAFTVTGLSALIGPPLGGALYSLGGFMLPFLVATGLVVLDGLGRLLFLPGNTLLPAMNPDRGTTRMLLRAPGFRIGLFGALAGALALSALEPGTPLLLGQAFGVPVWGIGVIFGALALCFVIMQPVVSRSERRLGTRLTLAIGLLLAALCFAGIAQASNIPSGWLGLPPDLQLPLIGVVVLLGVAGCALALVIVPVPELLTRSGQQQAGSRGVAYGAIYAAYDAAYAIGLLLGPLATGAAVAERGVAQSFLLLASLPAICALALLVWRTRAK